MKDATDITVILDRSGSMASIKDDTIGGFNQFVDEQKKGTGECRLTLVQFDSQNPQEVVFDNLPISDVRNLTDETFVPRASTPLYDAVGQAIVRTGERLKALPEHARPNAVIFVIVTDGYENASDEYTRERVFELIKHQTDVYSWQFVYLGANQDAMQVGASIGIPPQHAMTYIPDGSEVRGTYASLSANVLRAREASSVYERAVAMEWSDEQRQKSKGARKQQ